MLSYLVAFAVAIVVLGYVWIRGRRTIQRGSGDDSPERRAYHNPSMGAGEDGRIHLHERDSARGENGPGG